MAAEGDWHHPVADRGSLIGAAGSGSLRVTLLFGSAAVALALLLTPIAERQSRALVASSSPGIDRMTTGSIGTRSGGSYTIRRSVLQPTPNAVCIIRDNGSRTGQC